MKKILTLVSLCLLCLAVMLTAAAEENRKITLDREECILYGKRTVSLKATVEDLTEDAHKHTALVWTSSNKKIATVKGGKVTGVNPGTAEITVAAKDDPSLSVTIPVEVRKPVKSITMETKTLSLTLGGEETEAVGQVSCRISPKDAYWQTVTWVSSNEAVAVVDPDGTVHAVGGGKATITAVTEDPTCQSKPVCTVVVRQLVQDVQMEQADGVTAVGKTIRLKASVLPENAENTRLLWSSSDEKIATVDKNGTVKGVSYGSAVITAEAADGSGFSAECEVTVNAPVKKLSLSRKNVLLAEGTQWQITAKVTPDTASVRNLVWKSSNEEVATVTQDGLITGLSAGHCKVTVSTIDGSGISSVITVKVSRFDIVIDDAEGADVPYGVSSFGSKGGFYYTAKSRNHCVSIVKNIERKSMNISLDDLDAPHMLPKKAGEDTVVIYVTDYPDYMKHNTKRMSFHIYVSQKAVEEYQALYGE